MSCLPSAIVFLALLAADGAAKAAETWPSALDVAACAASSRQGDCSARRGGRDANGVCVPSGAPRQPACATSQREALIGEVRQRTAPAQVVVLAPRTLAKVAEHEAPSLPPGLMPVGGFHLRTYPHVSPTRWFQLDESNRIVALDASQAPKPDPGNEWSASIRRVVLDEKLPKSSRDRWGQRLVLERAGAPKVLVAPLDKEPDVNEGEVLFFNKGRSLVVAESLRFTLVRDVSHPKLEVAWKGAQPTYRGLTGSRESDTLFAVTSAASGQAVYAWKPLTPQAPKLLAKLKGRATIVRWIDEAKRLVVLDTTNLERRPTDKENRSGNRLLVIDPAAGKVEREVMLSEETSIELRGSLVVKGRPLALFAKQVVDLGQGKVLGTLPDFFYVSTLLLDGASGVLYYTALHKDATALVSYDPLAGKVLAELPLPKDPTSFRTGAQHLLLGRGGQVLAVFGEIMPVVGGRHDEEEGDLGEE